MEYINKKMLQLPSKEVKVVILGESAVGKTSLLHRFCIDEFKYNLNTTLGAGFMSKTIHIGEQPIKFQIWDTAGQEKYRALLPLYYRGNGAGGQAIKMPRSPSSSTTSPASRASRTSRSGATSSSTTGPRGYVTYLSLSYAVMVLVGNKTDLGDNAIDQPDLQAFCADLNVTLSRLTSCKEGHGVQVRPT